MIFAEERVEERVVEDLVISLLAVNHYSVEKVFDLLTSLRKCHIIDLKGLAGRKREDVYDALVGGGYDRGPFMNGLFIDRLMSLSSFRNGPEWTKFLTQLKKGDKSGAEQQLLKVHGVGPAVMRNFWLLHEKS